MRRRILHLPKLLCGTRLVCQRHRSQPLIAQITNASQGLALFGLTMTIHGVAGEVPFLTLPRSCGPAGTVFEADRFLIAGTPEGTDNRCTPRR